MTPLRPGEHADELISASLTGDLTEIERATLEQHLAGCERCRDTLNAFREERRLISGMRHLQPPADLGARVRAGIEAPELPWWQRRSTLVAAVGSLGAVAAGLLAVVVFSNLRPPVATASATPSASISLVPSVSIEPSPSVSIEASPSPVPSTTPVPQPSIDPNPVGTLRYTIRDQRPTLEVVTAEQSQEPVATALDIDRDGMPIDSALSPDGTWLAFRVRGDATGLVDTYAYRLADDELVHLSAMSEDSPFSRLAWSPDGSMLAFTAGTGDMPYPLPVDVWIFYADAAEPTTRQVTQAGAAFAADFYGTSDGENLLWVSIAGADPVTYGIPVGPEPLSAPIDPAAVAVETHPGAFLPVKNRANGTAAAVWHGQMTAEGGGGWHFVRGGMLYLADADTEGHFAKLGEAEQQVFDTLAMPPGGEAFESARFGWAPDGNGLAVWDAIWVGAPQIEDFPDEARVYFGHRGSDFTIGPLQALDDDDTAGGDVVQVSLAGGRYLALTIQTEPGSEGGSFGPTAELRLVTRNLGSVPDDVQTVKADKVWNGPAFYPSVLDHSGE
jgi:Putative zinc-finger/WD40-like Beta Propeller Repeat